MTGNADIFMSYAREDLDRIRPIVRALEERGYSVFWDQRIPAGKTWRSHLGAALEAARCVVVVWSMESVRSEWVTEEADAGKRRRILVPVRIDPVEPPFGFGSIQAADLTKLAATGSSPDLRQFLDDVGAFLGDSGGRRRPPDPPPPAPPLDPQRRWWSSRRPLAKRASLALAIATVVAGAVAASAYLLAVLLSVCGWGVRLVSDGETCRAYVPVRPARAYP